MTPRELRFPAPELERGVFHTITGRRIDLNNPSPSMYNPMEAAWALSRLSRWGGHARGSISVAYHSLHVLIQVIKLGGSLADQLAALHHDGVEALGMVDLPKGVKMLFPEYEQLEQRLWRHVVAPALGLDAIYYGPPDIVKQAEKHLRAVEWAQRFQKPDEAGIGTLAEYGTRSYEQFCNAHIWLQQLRERRIDNPKDPLVLDAEGWGDTRLHLARLHAQLESTARPWPCPPSLLPVAAQAKAEAQAQVTAHS